ncbi:hypothetical protein ASG84_24395 [Rhodococcus sp. Leaf278]|nr:hypothetical protein ASG84_24395 [Rhodococcus sp. Leaf278]
MIRELTVEECPVGPLTAERVGPIASADQPTVTETIYRPRPNPAAQGIQDFGFSRTVRQRHFPAIEATDQMGMSVMNSWHDHVPAQVDDFIRLGYVSGE